jgi:cytochrome c5
MSKIKSSRAAVILIATGLVLVAVLVACNSGTPAPTQVPASTQAPASTPVPTSTQASASTPALDGATLLETRCSACHSVDKAKQIKQTREQWGQTITDMIVEEGAQLTEAEKVVLVDYLTETYGP